MKRILKILSFICILISITSYAYASYTTYEAEEYILKIENINEELERIDLVNFEECNSEETGGNYTTTFEVIPLFGEESIDFLDKQLNKTGKKFSEDQKNTVRFLAGLTTGSGAYK
jgi:hypothetical protein